jgi:RimJ/RimL family protein N-acetyltransferase
MPQRTQGAAVPSARPGPDPAELHHQLGGRGLAGPAELPPELIDGGPVLLRRVRDEDAPAIAEAVASSMEHLRPWMPWATPESGTARAQRVRVAEADELWETGADFIYSILPAADGGLAGQIGLRRRVGDGGIEIGYWIAAGQVRRGLGTAAARAATGAALALPGITRVEIHCDIANTASAAIPRKLGYRLEAVCPHEPEAPGESGERMIWVRDRPAPPVPGQPGGAR